MRRFFDSAIFWTAIGGAVAAVGGIFLGVGASRTTQDASVWHDSWFDVGFVIVVLGGLALLWSLVLFLAHSHMSRYQDQASPSAARAPVVAEASQRGREGWVTPDELGRYLESITQTMEQHGFGRNPINSPISQSRESTPSFEELNNARVKRYQETRGLFLIHNWWTPSQEPEQIADVQIRLCQHGDGPLSRGEIKAVEYTLGPKFANHSLVCINAEEDFCMTVSMWGPMLCLAKVYFNDGSQPLLLERYINFDPSLSGSAAS